MVTDAERLRSPSLAPLARAALMRALTLRFGVLLTPAFWTTEIKRDLIYTEADADSQAGDTTASREQAAREREDAL